MLQSVEDQDRAGLPYWKNIWSGKLYTYTAPSPELEHILINDFNDYKPFTATHPVSISESV